MTQTAWDCADARPSLGVYVLGAIDPSERTLVDAHLATCRDCRDELAGLAGIPALLSRVSADEVGRISLDDAERVSQEGSGSEELLGSVISLTAARRRRNKWRNLALTAAAVVALVAGTVVGLRVSSHGGPSSSVAGSFQTESALNSATGVKATFRYAVEPWGTSIQTQVFHIPMGTPCVLWVTNAKGQHIWAGSWVVSSDEGRVWYPSSVLVPAAGMKGWDITEGVNGPQLISGPV